MEGNIIERRGNKMNGYRIFMVEFKPDQQINTNRRPYLRRILIDDAVAIILDRAKDCAKIKISFDCFLSADQANDVLDYDMYSNRLKDARKLGIDIKVLPL